jgi:hypothetical protein
MMKWLKNLFARSKKEATVPEDHITLDDMQAMVMAEVLRTGKPVCGTVHEDGTGTIDVLDDKE